MISSDKRLTGIFYYCKINRYNGLVSSTNGSKYLIVWRISHDKKRFVSDVTDMKVHQEMALYMMITVIKSQSKCYRLVDLMKMADIITKNMFYSYQSESTDVLNYFSNDPKPPKDPTKIDESHVISTTKRDVKEELQLTKEINSPNFKNYGGNSDLIHKIDESEDKNEMEAQEITNNIIVKQDQKGKTSSMISNNIMINKPGKGGKVIINNNIITNKSIGENDTVVINNNFYFNPYLSKFVSQSDLEIKKSLCIDSKVTQPRVAIKQIEKIDEEVISKKLGKDFEVPKRKLVTYGIHKGFTSETILGTMYKCNPVFSGKFIHLTNLIQKCNEIYDTSTIITGDIYQYLPYCIKIYCRLIDVVSVIKDTGGIQLYSIDCFPELQEPFELIDTNSTEARKKKQMVIKQLIEESIHSGKKQALFEDEMDIQTILANDEEFKFHFRNAIDFYLVGKWGEVFKILKTCLLLRPRDGPSIAIYKFIEEHQFVAPADWKGVSVRDQTTRLKSISD